MYTASWTAPLGSGVHSEQFFHYLGAKGEINTNQSRRGYGFTVRLFLFCCRPCVDGGVQIDGQGLSNANPFYSASFFPSFFTAGENSRFAQCNTRPTAKVSSQDSTATATSRSKSLSPPFVPCFIFCASLLTPLTQCQAVNAGTVQLADLDARLPTIYSTIVSTAILEAGRISLDEKRSVGIVKNGDAWSLQ